MKRIPTARDLAQVRVHAPLMHLVHRWSELFRNHAQRQPEFAPLFQLLRLDTSETAVFNLARKHMHGRSLDFRDPSAKRIADDFVVLAFAQLCAARGLQASFKQLRAAIVTVPPAKGSA